MPKVITAEPRLAPSLASGLLVLLVAIVGLAALPGAAAAKTVWLCKPGMADNPCTQSLITTRFSAAGERLGVERVKPAKDPKFDCLYFYPTVSEQSTPQSNLSIDPAQRSIAHFQAAPYSRYCRVFAPMYRQLTLNGLFAGALTSQLANRVFSDVVGAWFEYLRKYNKGRGVVLIGQSHGALLLRPLIARLIDPDPVARKQLISAVVTGGNVLVKRGGDVGGDFQNIPACRSKRQFGCVVAYSTFNGSPPPNAIWGRVGGLDALFNGLDVDTTLTLEARPVVEVLCTNPTDLGGGTGSANAIFPSKPLLPGVYMAAIAAVGFTVPEAPTPWVEVRKAYKASCSSQGGANHLQLQPRGSSPALTPVPDPRWGTHLVDVNIALGNLTALVRRQAASWLKASG